jgi:putative transposase
MKQDRKTVGLSRICGLFGVTRQAYYEALAKEEETFIEHTIVLQLVKEIRTMLSLIGTRKLLFMLEGRFKEHGLRIGRDNLFDILSFYGLLIRRRKRSTRTTNSHHWLKKYPNLIEDLIITEPEELWVADITYITTSDGFSYLSLMGIQEK